MGSLLLHVPPQATNPQLRPRPLCLSLTITHTPVLGSGSHNSLRGRGTLGVEKDPRTIHSFQNYVLNAIKCWALPLALGICLPLPSHSLELPSLTALSIDSRIGTAPGHPTEQSNRLVLQLTSPDLGHFTPGSLSQSPDSPPCSAWGLGSHL